MQWWYSNGIKHFIINIIINYENRDVKTTSKTSERR